MALVLLRRNTPGYVNWFENRSLGMEVKAAEKSVNAMLRDPNHLLIGSPAVELVPELGPEPSDLTSLRMHGVSPFGGTDLDGLLRNMQVHTLVVAGVSVNLGIPGLAIEAVNLGYEVVIARDAITGVGSEYVEDMLANTLRLIARITTVDELVAAWSG